MYQKHEANKSIAAWDDKEQFIRKAFDEDPVKGCELLFKQYHGPLCNHAIKFVYSREIAQDIVGDVFFTFWQKKLYLIINTSFRAYLFIAIRNRSINHLQKEFIKMEDLSPSVENEHISSSNPELLIQYHQLSVKIDQTIKSLPSKCQKIFLMSRYEGKKNKDIAIELAVSVKAIEAQITRALHVLRKALRDEWIW